MDNLLFSLINLISWGDDPNLTDFFQWESTESSWTFGSSFFNHLPTRCPSRLCYTLATGKESFAACEISQGFPVWKGKGIAVWCSGLSYKLRHKLLRCKNTRWNSRCESLGNVFDMMYLYCFFPVRYLLRFRSHCHPQCCFVFRYSRIDLWTLHYMWSY